MNKYDPRMSDKYAPHDNLPSKANAATKAGRIGTGNTPRGYVDGDTGIAGKEFDQHGQAYEPYHDTRASEQDMGGYGPGRGNYWATTAAAH